MGKGAADHPAESPGMFTTAKWATIVIGLLTALAGGALIAIGIYGIQNPLGAAMVPMTLPILAIIAGGSVLLLSIFGCFSSFGEHKNLLWVYFALMAALVFLQLVVGIAALHYRGDTIDRLADRRWDYLHGNSPRELRRIEEQYECCGLNYLDDRAWPLRPAGDRKSCSRNKDFGFDRPCIGPVHEEWEKRQRVFGIGVCTLAGLQLLGLIPVYYLAAILPTDDEHLLEEHRRLLETGSYGASRYYNPDAGARAERSPVQHSVGGPAGSYPYPGTRPGSRAG